MSDYIHQQNCTLCDKPGWLIGGYFYNILKITVDDTRKEGHRIVAEFRPHECEEAENAPD
ncbi:hypothetical protein LCGC14_2249280 [marine sediment metagenome]|uniref:Uncharacterized protein n=1 Tax=marine sediment metagenome TaxID=412755 RepID=A0A0F9FY22_9ZZZZ